MEEAQRVEQSAAPAAERMPMVRSPEMSTLDKAIEGGDLESIESQIEHTATRATEQGRAFSEAADDHDSPEFTQSMQDLSRLLQETLEARANQAELEIAGAITTGAQETPTAIEEGKTSEEQQAEVKLVELKKEKEEVDGKLKDLETKIAGATEEEKPALEAQHAELVGEQSELADKIGETTERFMQGGAGSPSGGGTSLEKAVDVAGKAMTNPDEAAGKLADYLLSGPKPEAKQKE